MKFVVLRADAKVNLFSSLRGGGDCTQAISSLEEKNYPNKPINAVENAITLGKFDWRFSLKMSITRCYQA